MWRNIAANFMTFLIVLLIAAAVVVTWGRNQYAGPGPSAVAQCVTVPQGASLKAVASRLVEQGAVSSAYIFSTGADYDGKAGQLKYGSYLVPPNASMRDIANVITAGGPSTCGVEVTYRVGVRENAVVLRDINPANGQYEERVKYNPVTEPAPEAIVQAVAQPGARLRVALAEGVTSWQVVEGLKTATFMSGEVPKVPPEGSLAPDTYIVTEGSDRQKLLSEMETRQTQILDAAWANREADLPYASPEEALVMASIVEKETGVPNERAEVAAVFVNRLRDGMRLQTDPTVIYGVTQGKGILDRGLRRSELVARTPFNTYVIEGLPPTPIANPGRLAIEAALHPAQSEYKFFVADGSGGHAFARTLEEHNANVARWREIERSRGQSTDSPVQSN